MCVCVCVSKRAGCVSGEDGQGCLEGLYLYVLM